MMTASSSKYCADMTDRELEALLSDSDIIRNRNKIFSVRKNARAVKKIQAEFGGFGTYLGGRLWSNLFLKIKTPAFRIFNGLLIRRLVFPFYPAADNILIFKKITMGGFAWQIPYTISIPLQYIPPWRYLTR